MYRGEEEENLNEGLNQILFDPSNVTWTSEKHKILIIPVYIGVVIKGISNIVIQEGKIDYNYTLVLRIPKRGLKENEIRRIC